MHINKSTICFSNGKTFCGKTLARVACLTQEPGQDRHCFPPKLADYFIQGMRKNGYNMEARYGENTGSGMGSTLATYKVLLCI
jgi:hypothetical protein